MSMSKKKKIRDSVITVILWLTIWQVTAMWMDNRIFLPSPIETIHSFQKLLQSAQFFQSIFTSLGNIVKGFLLGMFFGTLFAVLASASEFLQTFISLPMRMIKAIPVASFTILALFWLNSSKLSILVSFFMVLPILYTNIFTGIYETKKELLEMAKLFHIRWYNKICFIYVPSVLPYLCSSCSVAIGLAWKSGIAAEVIGITKNSIGHHLYQSKIYLEMPELFAWSFVIIVISIFSEYIVVFLLQLFQKVIYGVEKNIQEENCSVEYEKSLMEEERVEAKGTIWLENITKSYQEQVVLDKVSLTLSPKRRIALMGSSGIGKTTLFRILLGIETAEEGTIVREKGTEKFSVVFQENRLCEQLTVERNLKIVCKTRKQKEKIARVLCELGLSDCRRKKVALLSGGMKRRVAIARALVFDAPMLFMDEPFQGLDIETKQKVMEWIKKESENKTLFMITHDKEEANFLHCEIIEIHKEM